MVNKENNFFMMDILLNLIFIGFMVIVYHDFI